MDQMLDRDMRVPENRPCKGICPGAAETSHWRSKAVEIPRVSAGVVELVDETGDREIDVGEVHDTVIVVLLRYRQRI